MPITEKNSPKDIQCLADARALNDEQLAALISSYLDGELTRSEVEEFESLMREDDSLAREVQQLRKIGFQLTEIGTDILSEPIPDALLEALTRKGK